MIVRLRTVMLVLWALPGAVIAAPGAWAANITRGGQPAELTVTSGGAHGVRVTLKPVGMALPPSPSLLSLEIKNPVISLRSIASSMRETRNRRRSAAVARDHSPPDSSATGFFSISAAIAFDSGLMRQDSVGGKTPASRTAHKLKYVTARHTFRGLCLR